MKLVLAPLLLAAAAGLADEVIYNNTQAHTTGSMILWVMTDVPLGEHTCTVELPGGAETEGRAGAAITMAGSARFVTRIDVLGSTFPGAGNSAEVVFWLYSDAGGSPGSLLWTGAANLLVPSGSAPSTVTFHPNITIPNTVFYAITYNNITDPGRAFGAYFIRTAPVVGTAGQLMTQDSATLVWGPAALTLPNDGIEFKITAGTPCYPNCDGSTTAPVLNVQDFGCFINRFSAGDTYANCDNSTAAPVLNIQDFGCFLNAFGAGCS